MRAHARLFPAFRNISVCGFIEGSYRLPATGWLVNSFKPLLSIKSRNRITMYRVFTGSLAAKTGCRWMELVNHMERCLSWRQPRGENKSNSNLFNVELQRVGRVDIVLRRQNISLNTGICQKKPDYSYRLGTDVTRSHQQRAC